MTWSFFWRISVVLPPSEEDRRFDGRGLWNASGVLQWNCHCERVRYDGVEELSQTVHYSIEFLGRGKLGIGALLVSS